MFVEFGMKTVDFEDCKISGRNFAGREVSRNGRIQNGEGKRNFLLIISPEVYEELKDRGFNVGRFAEREEGVEPDGYCRVTVSYFKRPPLIHLISGDVVTDLDESRCYMLDNVNILNLDMRCAIVNKQNRDGDWLKNLFVDEMWVTITPDRFASKYEHLRHAGEDNV